MRTAAEDEDPGSVARPEHRDVQAQRLAAGAALARAGIAASAVVDLETARVIPWEPDTAALVLDFVNDREEIREAFKVYYEGAEMGEEVDPADQVGRRGRGPARKSRQGVADGSVDLIEGEGSEQDDFSNLSYTEAFDAMLKKFREEYAYTELKDVDWDAREKEFRPRFEEAEKAGDARLFALAKPDAIVMHPGPMNRGVEIASDVADGPASVILDQVANGVAVRMAVLYLLAGGAEHETTV